MEGPVVDWRIGREKERESTVFIPSVVSLLLYIDKGSILLQPQLLFDSPSPKTPAFTDSINTILPFNLSRLSR